MSLLSKTPKPPAYNPRNNQMPQRMDQYLNTLGNWHTYKHAASMTDALNIVSQVTRSFLGVDLGGRLSLTGVLGAILALHTLERLTAAAATFGLRLTPAAKDILAWHHGVAIRQSPFTPRTAQAMRWLLGSRLLGASGWIFQEGGRTWHYQVLTLRVWGAERVLAHLRSLSMPHRAYYFDRDISGSTAVEIALGYKLAELALGHLGSINELEHTVGLLARAKLIAVAANWLLVDPAERTAAAQHHHQPPGPTASHQRRTKVNVTTSSTTTAAAPPPPTQLPLMQAAPSTNGHSRSAYTSAAALPPPGDWVKNHYYLNGYAYPLLVRNVVTNPVTRQRKADALYYVNGRWQPVTRDADRIAIAEDFDEGRMTPQAWPQAA